MCAMANSKVQRCEAAPRSDEGAIKSAKSWRFEEGVEGGTTSSTTRMEVQAMAKITRRSEQRPKSCSGSPILVDKGGESLKPKDTSRRDQVTHRNPQHALHCCRVSV